MADTITLNSGSGGSVLATQDEAGVHYQEVKLTASGNGTTEALSKAEDTAHTTGEHGIMALAVRKDTATALAGTDGDYIPLITDANGRLHANAILAANSGVDIGDVDVTSVIPGVGATNLGKAEDAAHTTGDTGVMALAVRNDALSSLVGADGDYAPLSVDANGALHTYEKRGLVDSNNSSTTPLGISGVFTGTATEVTNYTALSIFVYTDQASATGGLSVQFSTDGTNWDHTEGFDVAASTSTVLQAPVEAQYFRLVYTNGTSAQSVFRLETILKIHPSLGSIAHLNESVVDSNNAQLTRSVLTGKNPGGTYTNIGTTTGGNLKTSIEEISGGLDIGAGNAGTETQRVSISTDDVNLSAIKTAVEIIDDWDETNRAAVNLIVGQAGIAAGTGVDGVTVPRVTLATDVGLPAGTSIIGKVDGAETENAAVSGNPLLIGGRYDSVARTLGDGDVGAIALTAAGHIIENHETSGIALGDAVSNTAVLKIGDAGTSITERTFPYVFNGTTWDRLRGDATDGLQVNLGANNDVTIANLKVVDLDDGAGTDNGVSVGMLFAGVSGATPVSATDPMPMSIQGTATSGGTTPYYNSGTATLTQIKGSAAQFFWISGVNLKASVVYLQLFNALSASVTLGTTAPTLEFAIPTQGDTNGAGFMLSIPNGVAFGTGFSYAITTTKGGATPVSANECILNLGYA